MSRHVAWIENKNFKSNGCTPAELLKSLVRSNWYRDAIFYVFCVVSFMNSKRCLFLRYLIYSCRAQSAALSDNL